MEDLDSKLEVVLKRRNESIPSLDAMCELLIYGVRTFLESNSYIENLKSLTTLKEDDLFRYLAVHRQWEDFVSGVAEKYYPEDEYIFTCLVSDLLEVYTLVTHSHRVKQR